MPVEVKKAVPSILSADARVKAAIRVGKAKSMAMMVKSMNHVNMGSFDRVIPGALSQIIETMKLILPRVTDAARRTIPRYASVVPDPWARTANGWYVVHPALAVPPGTKKLMTARSPPARYSQ